MSFTDKLQRLLDSFHTGEINEDQLAHLIQIALSDKVLLSYQVLYAKLTQVNGSPNS